MRPASSPLSYFALLSTLRQHYGLLKSHDDLVQRIGTDCLTDVTDTPEIRLMDALMPSLPPGYLQRVYNFHDPVGRSGTLEVAFHGPQLANLRAQLFFNGLFAGRQAKKFLDRELLPFMQALSGHSPVLTPNGGSWVFVISDDVTGLAYIPPRTTSVSTWMTDNRYIKPEDLDVLS